VPGRIDFKFLGPLVYAVNRRLAGSAQTETPASPAAVPPRDGKLADAFQRRRDVNVERLGRVGRLVAQSARVAEVYQERGVSGERMQTLPFTLGHIDGLRPRSLTSPPATVTFATLNGLMDRPKGAYVVLGALRVLRQAGLEGRFRLLAFGSVHPAVRAEVERYEGVELRGEYQRGQLDTLLEEADVGIMASIWEEAFGYAGVEMLAKGIPLIANPLGGIVQYAREGETAWLNHSCSAEGLAQLMSELIAEPDRVLDLHRRLLEVRSEVVTPMERHVEAIDAIYRELAPA
jgi:glycosyltransferase involved in cell wall biosynthesis